MKMRLIITGAAIFFLLGCVENMDINVPEKDLGRIVIEGEITDDEPPYFFRVSKTVRLNGNYNPGVSDALVILEDNEGVKDTLQHVKREAFGYYDWYYCLLIYDNKYNNRKDTVIVPELLDNTVPEDFAEGLFVTNKIRGKQKNMYTLTVKYGDQTFSASEQMPERTVIDSLWLAEKANEKEGSQITPFLNFRNDPAKENYYLFSFKRVGLEDMLQQDRRIWPFSIVEDKHMPENVMAFNPNDGESVRGYADGSLYFIYDTAIVRRGTISKSCYDFYSDLIQQMRYDGGAYTPAPSTGRSNFSNGALGYFRTIAVSEKRIKNEFYK
ncbi:MAG: DUF4249 domain-containing protein [Prevotella sp.]|jgi:hypothetical protein|nr:DUF4249 domain-containing protein [Prevotella sp.]